MITFLRVLAGTAVYVLIVVLAAPFPAAAGMMLTFPTLNGLAFAFAERRHVAGMARSMLWMPVLNGSLCAGYMLTFLALAHSFPPAMLAWTLTAIVAVLFFAVAFLPRVLAGIPRERQRTFAIIATAAGAGLVIIARLSFGGSPGTGPVQPHGAVALPADFVWAAILHNIGKIALFALCLAVFLVATRMMPLSGGVRGVLAGLPFVPFAGLLSVSGDEALDLALRLDLLRQMATSIWIGPAVAIWFIYGYARVVEALPEGSARAVPALGAAWAMCGLVIAAVTYALRW